MSNKSTKNNWLKNQNGKSPFVVDLRQAALKFEKEILKEEKQIKKNIKDLRPDLLSEKKVKKSFQFVFIKNLLKRDYFSFFKVPIKKKILRKNVCSLSQAILNKEEAFTKALKSKLKIGRSDRILTSLQEKIAWYRSIMAFCLVLFLLIIPFKIFAYFDLFNFKNIETKILSQSKMAMSNLMAASNSASDFDFRSADSDFKNAGQNFLEAQKDLNLINDSILSLASLSSDPKIKLAAESKNFLRAGFYASSMGRNLVLATDSLFNGDKNDFSLTLNNFIVYGQAAVKDSNNLKNVLAKINLDNLPEDYQAQFTSLNKQAILLSSNLGNFIDAGVKLKEAIGLSQDKRYLLVFQNNSELRASGGFLGSYALVDFRNGKIRNLEVPGGGSYDTEAGLDLKIIAPKPLWLVNPLWHFWDANWWADWPMTARNLIWFYEKSDGPTVDGVISITPTVIEDLLKITGPIDLTKEYGLVISSDNFWETVQKVVEQKNLVKTHPEYVADLQKNTTTIDNLNPLIQQDLENNASNKPKKIIGDLMAKIMEVLPQKLTKDNLVSIISLLEQNLGEKQIMFYFTDPEAQSAVVKRNWAGEIRASDKDYLMVVNTNIAGQKTDRKIVESIDHASEVQPDGTIINTVRIKREHTGVKNEPLVGYRNVNWMRVYVPLGSELISASGFNELEDKYLNKRPEAGWLESPVLKNENEAVIDADSQTRIYAENGKTVFANWSLVDPGQSTEIIIKYRLPFNFFTKVESSTLLFRINRLLNPDQAALLSYSFLLQKQPGAIPDNFSSHLFLPSGINSVWRYPENFQNGNGWEINIKLDSDKYWSILTVNK